MQNNIWTSTKIVELGSCAFRQWKAQQSHCQYLHGYQLKAKIWVSGKTLDDKNWIFDFGSFKEIKKILSNIFDHKVCVSKDDPELDFFKEAEKRKILQLTILDAVGIEKTAEYVYHICDQYIRESTDNRCWVSKVEVWEHPENSATFEILEEIINCDNTSESNSSDQQIKIDLSAEAEKDYQTYLNLGGE